MIDRDPIPRRHLSSTAALWTITTLKSLMDGPSADIPATSPIECGVGL
jgi:hypothetical protein